VPGREELEIECRFDREDGIILVGGLMCDVGGSEAHDDVLLVSGKSFLWTLAKNIVNKKITYRKINSK